MARTHTTTSCRIADEGSGLIHPIADCLASTACIDTDFRTVDPILPLAARPGQLPCQRFTTARQRNGPERDGTRTYRCGGGEHDIHAKKEKVEEFVLHSAYLVNHRVRSKKYYARVGAMVVVEINQ